ncbi:unnamed protein product [Prunus brigantina]
MLMWIMIGSLWGRITPRSSSSQKVMGAHPNFSVFGRRPCSVLKTLCAGWEMVHILVQLALTDEAFYNACCLISGGEAWGGEDLKPRLGCEGEWSPIICPRRVAPVGLVVVAMSALLAIAEGMLAGGGSAKVFRAEVARPPLELKYRKLDSWRPLLKAQKGVRSSVSRQREYSWLNRTAYSRIDGAGAQPVEPIQGRATEGGREEEAHAFVNEALAPHGKLERMYMGERILRASVEGDAEGLDVFLLVVIKDAFGKGPRSWLRPEGLVAALLLAQQAPDLLKEKPHGRVGMRESLGC